MIGYAPTLILHDELAGHIGEIARIWAWNGRPAATGPIERNGTRLLVNDFDTGRWHLLRDDRIELLYPEPVRAE